MTVAVATATDAMQRSIIGRGDGVGLRGGTFHTDYSGSWTTTLTNCSFARDVTVSGTATWDVPGLFAADLTVSGSGTAGGTCTSRERGKRQDGSGTSKSVHAWRQECGGACARGVTTVCHGEVNYTNRNKHCAARYMGGSSLHPAGTVCLTSIIRRLHKLALFVRL